MRLAEFDLRLIDSNNLSENDGSSWPKGVQQLGLGEGSARPLQQDQKEIEGLRR